MEQVKQKMAKLTQTMQSLSESSKLNSKQVLLLDDIDTLLHKLGNNLDEFQYEQDRQNTTEDKIADQELAERLKDYRDDQKTLKNFMPFMMLYRMNLMNLPPIH